MRAVYVCVGLLVILSFVCSRAPVEPEPNPCDECSEPCDPVPCDVVPCDIVEVSGVYEIFVKQDRSVPNSAGLLKNDIAIFDTVLSVPGSGEFRVEISGTYKQGDILEGFSRGSNSGIRFAFHANE